MTFRKRIIFFIVITFMILSYVYMNYNKIRYIDPESKLSGELWFELKNSENTIKSIAYGNGLFVGVGEDLLGYSTDAIHWNFDQNTLNPHTHFNDIIFAQGKFVAVSDKQILTSANGLEWERFSIDDGEYNNLYSIAYGDGKFVVIGSGEVYTSTDGIYWTPHPNQLHNSTTWSICYGDNQFVAVAPYTTATSKDGSRWEYEEGNIPFKSGFGYLSSVAYANGTYIAIGGIDDTGSMIWHSKDGEEWKTIAKVNSIVNSGSSIKNQFYFTGGKSVLHSTDGKKWTVFESEVYSRDIVLAENSFVITGFSYPNDNGPVSGPAIMVIPQELLVSN